MDVVYALRDEVQELKQVGSEFFTKSEKSVILQMWFISVRKGSKFIKASVFTTQHWTNLENCCKSAAQLVK